MESYTPEQIWDWIIKLFSWSGAKYALAGTIMVIVNFWNSSLMIHKLMDTTIALICLDTISGIMASVLVRKEPISSCIMGRGLIKVMIYLLIVLIAITLGQFTGTNPILTLLVLSIIVGKEGLSVLENIRGLYEKYIGKWPFEFLVDKFKDISKTSSSEKE